MKTTPFEMVFIIRDFMIKKELSKMTKKEKKQYYKQFRNTWDINPVTRKPQKPKAYNRRKFRSLKNEFQDGIFLFIEKYVA